MNANDVVKDISLVCANFGNGDVFPIVQEDWFQFLGGKPGEVVVFDGGSDAATQNMYWDLFHQGRIDKLQLLRSDHPENDKSRCYIQEYYVALLACKPYVLFYKTDTFPFRAGLDDWLVEAVEHLERPEVFAISGGFNWNCKEREAWPGWYYSQWCTENFALMKRESFVQAMDEFAGEFIKHCFVGDNPAGEEGKNGRFLIEIGWNWYMKKHDLFTLVQEDNEEWTVLHTNLQGKELLDWREKFYQREGVARCVQRQMASKYPYGIYYGHGFVSILKRHLRIALGRSFLGVVWRSLRQRFHMLFS